MDDREFRARPFPLDCGVTVTVDSIDALESEVYVETKEYRSDYVLVAVYVGDRARAMRENPITASQPAAAVPQGVQRPRLVERDAPKVNVTTTDVADDYVPPPVAEQVAMELAARRQGQEPQDVMIGSPKTVFDPLPASTTSRPPRAPRDRTSAQRRALQIDTTMPTSLGETKVQVDLTGMLENRG